MKVQITSACTGHGMCYVHAPEVFTDDEQGYGQPIADGTVAPGAEESARTAAANCPEGAINILD